MATLLVGDVHGCYDELQALLHQASFDPKYDTLWLTGDLVARGPHSLQVLRFVRDLGGAACTVLGNHDLHLLAVAAGIKPWRVADRLQEVLEAPDRDELLEWLRHQPLLRQHAEFPLLMVHAGVSPQWDLKTTLNCAQAVEKVLQSQHYPYLLAAIYGEQPDYWSETLQGMDRLRYSLNALTRMRFCYADGRLALQFKCAPQSAPASVYPWFKLPSPTAQTRCIIFGHWAALRGQGIPSGFQAMDTGCVWGGDLSLLRWDDQVRFTQALLSPLSRSKITKRQE